MAHFLGTVVASEALHAHPGNPQTGAGWPPPTRPTATPACLTDYSSHQASKAGAD